jgi:hypothetical protein
MVALLENYDEEPSARWHHSGTQVCFSMECNTTAYFHKLWKRVEQISYLQLKVTPVISLRFHIHKFTSKSRFCTGTVKLFTGTVLWIVTGDSDSGPTVFQRRTREHVPVNEHERWSRLLC